MKTVSSSICLAVKSYLSIHWHVFYMALEMVSGLQVNVVQLLTARLALSHLCALMSLLGHSRSDHSVLQSCSPACQSFSFSDLRWQVHMGVEKFPH